jgi:hypothetical protein
MSVTVLPTADPPVPLDELCLPNQSGGKVITLTSYEATRYYIVPWENAVAQAIAIAGNVAGGGAPNDIVYTMPMSDPDVAAAVAVSVQIDPYGKPDQLAGDPTRITYDQAILTVKFSTAGVQPQTLEGGGIVLVTEDLEPWSEYLPTSNRSLFWSDGSHLDETQSPPRLVRGLAWVYRTHFQQQVPQAAINLIGKVNDSQLTSANLGLTFDEETLLFTPPRMSIGTDAGGNRSIDLEYRFLARDSSWNEVWNPIDQASQPIFTDAAGTTPYQPYEPASFAGLVG